MKSYIYDGTAFKTPPHRQNMFNTSQVFGSQMGHLSQMQYPMPFFFSQPLSQPFQHHNATDEDHKTEFNL